MKSRTSLPTAEALLALEREHPMLAGGVAFVEGVSTGTWRATELVAWFDAYLVDPGYMLRPSMVSDPAYGTAPLHAAVSPTAMRAARFDDVPAIATRARLRVLDTLRGFLATPCDDRFLQAAIFADRVTRARVGAETMWVPALREIDALANIALSLFAADILAHREFHEAQLCVCEVCGRVSFEPEQTTRTGCARHSPRTESTSGFQFSATQADDDDDQY